MARASRSALKLRLCGRCAVVCVPVTLGTSFDTGSEVATFSTFAVSTFAVSTFGASAFAVSTFAVSTFAVSTFGASAFAVSTFGTSATRVTASTELAWTGCFAPKLSARRFALASSTLEAWLFTSNPNS